MYLDCDIYIKVDSILSGSLSPNISDPKLLLRFVQEFSIGSVLVVLLILLPFSNWGILS